MVFVDHVVTVQWNLADEVAEAEINHRLHVVLQPENVFPTLRNQPGVLWRLTIDRKGLEFLEVHVNRVLPTAGVVLEDPFLHRVALNGKTDVVGIFTITHKLAVDLPLTIAPFKPERARNTRLISRVGEAIELGDQRGVDAVVGDHGAVDDNFHDLVALTCPYNIAIGSSAVILLQTVLDIERLAGIGGEIHNHVHALGYREAGAVDLHRLLHQIAVGRDLPERLGGIVRSEQEHLVEARRSGIQPAESISPRAYVEHGLYLAVDQEFVTQDAVGIEQIKLQQSGLVIKDFVVEHHVDVKTCKRILTVAEAGQTESSVLVTGVELIEENVGTGKTFVCVFGCVVDAVVVIPQRGHRLLEIAGAWVRRVDPRIDVWIVMVIKLAALHKEAGKTITLKGRVPVMQVCGNRRQAEAAIVERQVITQPQQDRTILRSPKVTVPLDDHGARSDRVAGDAVYYGGKTPDGL